jgi:hypothetical protein
MFSSRSPILDCRSLVERFVAAFVSRPDVVLRPTMPERADLSAYEPHQARQIAESFGSNPERYDRARPGYSNAIVERLVA